MLTQGQIKLNGRELISNSRITRDAAKCNSVLTFSGSKGETGSKGQPGRDGTIGNSGVPG